MVCIDCEVKTSRLKAELKIARTKRNTRKAQILTKELKDLKKQPTHKLQAMDGAIIYVCDEHFKGWLNCTEILPLKTRIAKNKFKLALVALLLITNIVWAILYYNLWHSLPEEIVTL